MKKKNRYECMYCLQPTLSLGEDATHKCKRARLRERIFDLLKKVDELEEDEKGEE